MRNLALAAMPVGLFFVQGCSPDAPHEAEEETGSVQQPEPWSPRDDPALFSNTLERLASALPRSGEAFPVAWPGSYWPTSNDSINARWDGPGTRSPAKKYELAFGLSGVEDAVSRHHGVDSLLRAKVCTSPGDCASGESCAKREGAPSGRCVPTWYGICHGWAPAAILFLEPRHEVVKNGVTFKVNDIKALLSLVHDTTYSRFLSSRCNDSDAEGKVRYDEHGRATPVCRDTNAGTFHIIVTNYIGIHRRSFIEDRHFDQQVWNHPIRGYTIVEQRPVTVDEAHRIIGARVPPPQPPDGGAPDGGSPIPDGGAPAPDGGVPIPDAGLPPAPEPMRPLRMEGEQGYLFNPRAESLQYVKMDVRFIFESNAATDGNLSRRIDSYTGTTRYEYVLELDAAGEIIGGEWAIASKRNHPDFLWLPIENGAPSAAGGLISYAKVKELALASVTRAPASP
jgi:hypothetical protein